MPSHNRSKHRKKNFVKNGRNPTHPCGKYRIDAATAAHINRQYSLITQSTLKKVHDGDKICTSCWRKILKEKFEYDNNETDVIESMSVDEAEWFDYDDDDEKIVNGNDYGQVDNNIEELPSSQEQRHKKEEVRRKLNIIFELLNIPTIRDM
ncbi:unnamed protein product [Rotaria sordida]|uniref:Uncharacterized protein n=1 Tax=Rotaria sordida TaxID=392033 RepID=A0A819RWE3_9BILA|nr:unnamed protein product [Rotaria sordida]